MMARLTFFFPPEGRPGKRWRYLVQQERERPRHGGTYYTNRLDAADHARRAALSSGERYKLIDRATNIQTAAPLAAQQEGER